MLSVYGIGYNKLCWLDVPIRQLCDEGSYLPESSIKVVTGVKQENFYKKDWKDSIKN